MKSYEKKLNSYHQTCWKKIQGYLKKYTETKNNRTLHLLRVEIKKIKALVNFLEFNHISFADNKDLKSLKKLFKLLGEKRDYYHATEFCKEFNLKESFLKTQWDKPTGIVKKIKNNQKKYKKAFARLQEEIQKNIINTNIDDLEEYLIKCDQEIDAIFTKAKDDTNLHPTRKIIKDIIYLASGLNVNESCISAEKLKILDELQSLIGDLHDISIFYDDLQYLKPSRTFD